MSLSESRPPAGTLRLHRKLWRGGFVGWESGWGSMLPLHCRRRSRPCARIQRKLWQGKLLGGARGAQGRGSALGDALRAHSARTLPPLPPPPGPIPSQRNTAHSPPSCPAMHAQHPHLCCPLLRPLCCARSAGQAGAAAQQVLRGVAPPAHPAHPAQGKCREVGGWGMCG